MKPILLFVFLLISSTAFSQLTKGALLLEGSGNVGSSKSESEELGSVVSNNKQFSFSLRPSLGIMISEKWMLGAGIGYDYGSSSSEYTYLSQINEQTSNAFLLNAFLRRYAKLNDKLYFTATLNAGGGLGTIKAEMDDDVSDPETTDYDTYQASISVAPGLTYFISTKWAITGSIGQLYTNFYWRKTEDEGEENKNFSSSTGLNFRLNTFSIGVQYFLRNGTE